MSTFFKKFNDTVIGLDSSIKTIGDVATSLGDTVSTTKAALGFESGTVINTASAPPVSAVSGGLGGFGIIALGILGFFGLRRLLK